ncbi:normal mucosa of esophagus-specific gene 1 protein-like [Arapaima gigas]
MIQLLDGKNGDQSSPERVRRTFLSDVAAESRDACLRARTSCSSCCLRMQLWKLNCSSFRGDPSDRAYGIGVSDALTASIYSLLVKSNVSLNKTKKPEPWEEADPSKPQKLLTIN